MRKLSRRKDLLPDYWWWVTSKQEVESQVAAGDSLSGLPTIRPDSLQLVHGLYTRMYASGETSRARDLADILLAASLAQFDAAKLKQAINATLQMSEARTLLIDSWMGHENADMSSRYGKQLLDNVRWRQDCAAKVGLGFTLPKEETEALLDKSGQVLKSKEPESVAA